MGLLDTTCMDSLFSGGLGGKLFAGGLSSNSIAGGLAGGLLGTSHVSYWVVFFNASIDCLASSTLQYKQRTDLISSEVQGILQVHIYPLLIY